MNKNLLKVVLFVLVVSVCFGSFLAFAQPPANQVVTETDEIASVEQAESSADNDILYIAIAIVVGFASISAGWAVSTVGSAALGAISEKPELAGRALIFVGLAEGIAIYGLIIAIMMLGKAG